MNDGLVIKDFKINWQLLMFTRRREIRVKSVTYECQDGSVVIFKKKNFICIQKDMIKKKISLRIQCKADGMLNSQFQCLLY